MDLAFALLTLLNIAMIIIGLNDIKDDSKKKKRR